MASLLYSQRLKAVHNLIKGTWRQLRRASDHIGDVHCTFWRLPELAQQSIHTRRDDRWVLVEDCTKHCYWFGHSLSFFRIPGALC